MTHCTNRSPTDAECRALHAAIGGDPPGAAAAERIALQQNDLVQIRPGGQQQEPGDHPGYQDTPQQHLVEQQLGQRSEEVAGHLSRLDLVGKQRLPQDQRDQGGDQRGLPENQQKHEVQVAHRGREIGIGTDCAGGQPGVQQHGGHDAHGQRSRQQTRVGANHPQRQIEDLQVVPLTDGDAVLVQLHGHFPGTPKQGSRTAT